MTSCAVLFDPLTLHFSEDHAKSASREVSSNPLSSLQSERTQHGGPAAACSSYRTTPAGNLASKRMMSSFARCNSDISLWDISSETPCITRGSAPMRGRLWQKHLYASPSRVTVATEDGMQQSGPSAVFPAWRPRPRPASRIPPLLGQWMEGRCLATPLAFYQH